MSSIHYMYEYFMKFHRINLNAIEESCLQHQLSSMYSCSYNVYSDFIFLYAGCLPTAFTRRGLQWNAAWYAA